MGGEEPRDPIDFEGFHTQKNLPTGDFREREFPNNLKQVIVICPECRNASRPARRHCGTCGGEGKVTKHVTEDELEGLIELNCSMWAEVDFGKGPVEVRCTASGEHDEHMCVVEFNEEEPSADPKNN